VGKTTITRGVERSVSGSVFSVSWTTRDPTPADKEGVDYHFVDDRAFEEMRARGGFLESAGVYGRKYGTPREWVETQLSRGRLVILEIDVQGAIQVKRELPEAYAVFIEPPNEAELLQRLRSRKREDEEKKGPPLWKKAALIGVVVIVIVGAVYVFRGPLLVAVGGMGQFFTQQGQRITQFVQTRAGAVNPTAVDRAEQAAERVVAEWGVMAEGPGPLQAEAIAAFRSGKYIEKILNADTVFYRYYGGAAEKLGLYWTSDVPRFSMPNLVAVPGPLV
jgi:guanylate kinase